MARQKKSQELQTIEYMAAIAVIFLVRSLPVAIVRAICAFLGNAVYLLLAKRRNIALLNLRSAFGKAKEDREIKRIARRSCASFLATAAELVKFHFEAPGADALKRKGYGTAEFKTLFQKAKKIHDESRGCIFVTPHIGNWELLPYVSSLVGIPVAIVARPLDNKYLEKLIYDNRTANGQVIVPKKNAFFTLQSILRQGRSIAMLPDQATNRGVSVNFFGNKATTTPIPAILAIMYKRPIVVVACCRRTGTGRFEGFVSDPIWAGPNPNEREEILRLTEAMNRQMEAIIHKYPEQYLWMHNRWKQYGRKKEFLY